MFIKKCFYSQSIFFHFFKKYFALEQENTVFFLKTIPGMGCGQAAKVLRWGDLELRLEVLEATRWELGAASDELNKPGKQSHIQVKKVTEISIHS